MIIIIDYGSQYTHLICRRVREFGVKGEIFSPEQPLPKDKSSVKGVILSGSPYSLGEKMSPELNKALLSLDVPVLGICYGMQLIAGSMGGKVGRKGNREYGKTTLKVTGKSRLFEGISRSINVWMSHFDRVEVVPEGFSVIGTTGSIPVAAMENISETLYGLQFHPEVAHTDMGEQIIKNFLFKICRAPKDWDLGEWIDIALRDIKKNVGKGKVIMALSGGVDSSVASVLIQKAIGKKLYPIFVDHGLTRWKDRERIEKILVKKMGINVKIVDCEERFLKALKGVRDPEKKRKIIGKEFIKVFTEEAKKISGITHLAQGTLYPDVIESAQTGKASKIKSHHNVGGLPASLSLKLIEPFRMLYKDEVRNIGKKLGVPKAIIQQHPFPGPGLGIRIIGAVSRERAEILRKADVIVENELKKAGVYYDYWQAFPVFLPVRTVGVMGDKRTHENVIALRIVESKEAMTANWAHVPYDVLGKISTRIVNEISGINRVVYDITNKPPGTIEWE
jgi:GMP synthase (glutamine-hydrolysing)